MKNILICGSTGMVGGLALRICLDRKDVQYVTSISRRSTGIKHPKLKEIIHEDFLDFSAVEDNFKQQDVCLFCIGVYTGQVSRELFRTITVDYTRTFAETLKKHSPEATFCFLSGQGADSQEKSRVMFAKDKGIAENLLLKLKFMPTYIFRPGYIYPVTPRKEPNFSYKLLRVVYKPISKIYPNIGLSSVDLASAMVHLGIHANAHVGPILENIDIRKISQNLQ